MRKELAFVTLTCPTCRAARVECIKVGLCTVRPTRQGWNNLTTILVVAIR